MANLSHITRCGLPGIEWVPFGMHACHFYSSTDQLVAALVPYAVAGLRSNDRCLWVTAKPFRRCAPRATTSTTPFMSKAAGWFGHGEANTIHF